MMGWWIVIADETPEERDANPDKKSAVIASWESSFGGLTWLKELAMLNKATKLLSNGYPNRYVARAGDVLPLIENGPPKHADMDVIGDDYVIPNGWSGQITLHHEKIAACHPDSVLTIDAWDQS